MNDNQKEHISQKTIRIERNFPVAAERLYDAWVNPESVRQWMCPGDTSVSLVEMDVRLGGQFRIVMRTGADDLEHTGEYRLLERPKSIVFTWKSAATHHRPTLVTLNFERVGDNETKLLLVQEQLPDKQAADKHLFGWTDILRKLGEAVCGPIED